ncbi:MAG: DNA mismatch repair protein MutS [Treponema sp.]|nr:DNA mismatch repair protein MutS [Treponema sp.]
MMDQYRRIKRDHQGEVLFFRLGDFYEMFFEDALEVSALLNLTLTSRQGYPMCGIPYHASRSYIARLLKEGKKVAICEQLSAPGKGLIERKVVEVITPGTSIDEDFLEKGNSNYLASLAHTQAGSFSFSYIDLSTGDFFSTAFGEDNSAERLRQELERLQARELIVQESLLNEFPAIARAIQERGTLLNRWADWLFDLGRSRDRLEKQFGGASLKGFGLSEKSPQIISAGALLDYLDDTAGTLIPHVRYIKIYGDNEYLGLDESTQRNLELVRNLQDGESRFSLLEVMDETKTAMGRRLLRTRILQPLIDESLINLRLDNLDYLYHSQEKLIKLREILGKTQDLERLCSRIALDKAHGKDMLAVRNVLSQYACIKELALSINFESDEALSLNEHGEDQLKSLRDLLEKAISEDPSILLSEGNLIKRDYNSELDRLHELKDSGRKLLEEYLEEEKQKTGITGLKIKYNRFIGYFFEVSNVNLGKVPEHFIRRQGIAGGERFSTERLAALESDINGASDRIIETEKRLFLELRDEARALLPCLTAAGRRIAEIDCVQSLARAATIHGWSRPVINAGSAINIIEGRHPVVEAYLRHGEFIPNDIILDAGDTSFALITGPNMAGKSTYLRQAALITIMAQSGSFVPARQASIGLVDRIYCRVGAQDNLARGESTFLVEMNETAFILNTATEKSLVIMDEVGRGTGTEDGLSIARAVCEDLLERIKCRTLFATHYHELSRLLHPRMVNRSMEVSERDGEVLFLRKLRNGPAGKSYGLHVAALAGLPDTVINRAKEIMGSIPESDNIPLPKTKTSNNIESKIIKAISELDINSTAPIKALTLIRQWQRSIEKPGKNRGNEPSLFNFDDDID